MAVNPVTGEVTRAKYRRRGKLVTVTRRAICRVKDVESGSEFDLDEAAFDREYERVEEKALWGRCVRCGCAFVVDDMWDTGPGGFKHCYPECWAGDKLTPKKPTPLTLADLKPGDVFRDECGKCQRDHQLLRPALAFCAGPRGLYRPNSARVVFLHPHPLTPKQQLWIDATDEERKALDDSIRDKWLPRVKGEDSTGACALCALEGYDSAGYPRCYNCLLHKADERCDIGTSPWGRWRTQTQGVAKLANDWSPTAAADYSATRNMALSLAMFLPNIHPTRIEVEATAVEWPGASK